MGADNFHFNTANPRPQGVYGRLVGQRVITSTKYIFQNIVSK